jgi:hypothetical protein
MMTSRHKTWNPPTFEPSSQYSHYSQDGPEKFTPEKIDTINKFVRENKDKDFRDHSQRAPKQLTLEARIKQDFQLYDFEVKDLTDKYYKLTAVQKEIWDKEEIEKINAIDNIQDLSEEDISTILYGTISPVAQERMWTRLAERIMNARANSPKPQEESLGGRRRRNKKRSIIRKKKRGKKTRKYRNIY